METTRPSRKRGTVKVRIVALFVAAAAVFGVVGTTGTRAEALASTPIQVDVSSACYQRSNVMWTSVRVSDWQMQYRYYSYRMLVWDLAKRRWVRITNWSTTVQDLSWNTGAILSLPDGLYQAYFQIKYMLPNGAWSADLPTTTTYPILATNGGSYPHSACSL